VLDFGISVVVEKAIDASAATVVTTHGTPAYMSPEHITNAPDIDERADVYGFGVLLFEALTGQLPFVGEPGPALLMRILNEAPPSPAVFRPDLRPDVVQIIERAMAKSPDDRFESLNRFIRVLEENFLPALPLPRSLTPMIGVAILDHASQPRAVAEPVQDVRSVEASGPCLDSITKELYGLSGDTVLPPAEPGPSREEAAPGPSPGRAAPITPGLDRADLSGADRAKAIGVMASAAAFVAALVVVAWMAVPRRSEVRLPAGLLRTSAAPTTRPAAVKSPFSPAVAPSAASPALEIAAPAESPQAEAPGRPAGEERPTAPSPAFPEAAAFPAVPVSPALAPGQAAAYERAGRSNKRHGKDGAAPRELGLSILPPEPAPVLTVPKLPPPRAGSLSPDDF
jgi:serine/threonine-protein kinase